MSDKKDYSIPVATAEIQAIIHACIAWRISAETDRTDASKKRMKAEEAGLIAAMKNQGFGVVQIPALIATITEGPTGQQIVSLTKRNA